MKVTKYILEISIENGSSNRDIKIDDILNDNIPEYIESATPFSIHDTIMINDVLYNIVDYTNPNYRIVNGGVEVVTKISLSAIIYVECEVDCSDGWYINKTYYDDDLCPF